MLVGDAARFVSLSSTGVLIAVHSSHFAYRDILRALETVDFQRVVLRGVLITRICRQDLVRARLARRTWNTRFTFF